MHLSSLACGFSASFPVPQRQSSEHSRCPLRVRSGVATRSGSRSAAPATSHRNVWESSLLAAMASYDTRMEVMRAASMRLKFLYRHEHPDQSDELFAREIPMEHCQPDSERAAYDDALCAEMELLRRNPAVLQKTRRVLRYLEWQARNSEMRALVSARHPGVHSTEYMQLVQQQMVNCSYGVHGTCAAARAGPIDDRASSHSYFLVPPKTCCFANDLRRRQGIGTWSGRCMLGLQEDANLVPGRTVKEELEEANAGV